MSFDNGNDSLSSTIGFGWNVLMQEVSQLIDPVCLKPRSRLFAKQIWPLNVALTLLFRN